MTKFTIKYLVNFKAISADEAEERIFSTLWKQKEYSLAFEMFPKKWHWAGVEIGNEITGDIIFSLPSGITLSERAFIAIKTAFPNEVIQYGSIQIDGNNYYWLQPPVDNINTKLNMFISKQDFIKIFSDKFVQHWTDHGFTGCEFIELKR